MAAGEPLSLDGSVHVVRSLPHGRVAAVLGTIRKIGLDRVLAARPFTLALRARQQVAR